MLDLIEQFTGPLDHLDTGQSMRMHGWLWPGAPPQSLCSRIIDARLFWLAWLIGWRHCLRSWERYQEPALS